jgi:hypothetical protein
MNEEELLKFAQEVGQPPEVVMQKIMDVQRRAAAGDPSSVEAMKYFADRGLIQPQQSAPPRGMVAEALRNRPADFRPVERNEQGMPAPSMDASGYPRSKQYGGTVSSGMEGVGPQPLSPDDLALHYSEQQMLQEARQPIGNTSVSQGGRVTAPADTEVRPWAQRTPAGYKERGLDPKQSPLQPVRRARGAPLTYPSAATADDEAILRMLMGQ